VSKQKYYYNAWATGWTTGIRFPRRPGNSSLLHRVQTGAGAHPASYTTRIGAFSPGVKVSGEWSWPLTSI